MYTDRTRAVFGWLATGLIGLALGYGAIAGKDAYDHAKIRKQMTHSGEFQSLLAEYGNPRAIMVVRDGCRFCEMGRAWLKGNHIVVAEEYRAKGSSLDSTLSKLGVSGTPILLFPDKYVMGFDESVWNTAFEGSGGTQGSR